MTDTGINVNPDSQKHLLQYAKKSMGEEKKKNEKAGDSSDEDLNDGDYSKFDSKKTLEA